MSNSPTRLYIPAKLRRLNKLLDKQELAIALDLSGDPSYQRLATLLRGIDPPTGIRLPEIERLGIGALCYRTGISYNKVVEAYKQFKRSEAVISAAQHLPAIVEGIAIDAQPREVTCAQCEGTGEIQVTVGEETKTKRCIPCEGSGKVRQAGDPVARKQVLEMMELVGKGAMTINAPGANMVVGTGETLEETLRAARRGRQEAGTEQEQRTIDAPADGKVQ
jgi:hypothetical protein